MLDNYIDLTDSSTELDKITISASGFDCSMYDENGQVYKGFILAKSDSGNAYTICDVSFHYSETDKKYPPRLEFRRTNSSLEDKAINKGHRIQRISFRQGEDGYREFWHMITFLGKFKDLVDLGEFVDQFQVVTTESVVQHLNAKEPDQRREALLGIIEEADLSENDIADSLALKSRKDDLEVFKKLLDDEDQCITQYRAKYTDEIKGRGEEAVWHHFLSNHKWIFGLSLDLRFIEDFADEANVGVPDTSGSGSPTVDMLGWSDYTILVELKTPKTEMFTKTKTTTARANTWSFSPEFIDGFSQCLAQKTELEQTVRSKDITVTQSEGKHDLDKGIIRTVDPQMIFIIGHKKREIPKTSSLSDIRDKRDTLERFIRNNRNVNIISFDELYVRAYHIVFGTAPSEEQEPAGTTENEEVIKLDDIPF
jgi:hypothetical protein